MQSTRASPQRSEQRDWSSRRCRCHSTIRRRRGDSVDRALYSSSLCPLLLQRLLPAAQVLLLLLPLVATSLSAIGPTRAFAPLLPLLLTCLPRLSILMYCSLPITSCTW